MNENVLSLEPERVSNLAEGDYTLTISGKSLWHLQLFVYDYVERRRALNQVSRELPNRVQLSKDKLIWIASPIDWLRVFSLDGQFNQIADLMSREAKGDMTSEDRFLYLKRKRSEFRTAFLVMDRDKIKEGYATLISDECPQEELESTLPERLILSNRGWPIGSTSLNDRRYNGINVTSANIWRVEKLLLDSQKPIITCYAVDCVLADESETKDTRTSPFGNMDNMDSLGMYYSSIKKEIDRIVAGGHTRDKYYAELTSKLFLG